MAKRKEAVRSRNQEIRKVKVSDLEDAPWNFRRHSEHQAAALEGAIDEIGLYGYPDVYETPEGKLRLCDGHLRKALYVRKYGASALIEVNVTDFDETEARKATATKDPIAAMAETDAQALAELLDTVDFKSDSVLDMLRDLAGEAPGTDEDEPEVVEDEVPEPPADPITKPGDVWILGDHRVMCGDSTDESLVEKLLGKRQAFAVITDPPYGVDYVGKTKDALLVHNDGADTLLPLLQNALGIAERNCRKGGAWYVAAPAGPQFYDFGTVLRAMGIWRQTLVWVKNTLVLGRSDYHYQHEVIFYGWKPGGPHLWLGDFCETTVHDDAKPIDLAKLTKPELIELARDLLDKQSTVQTTVIREPKPSRSLEHPTMKPVKLFARFIKNSVKKGELIYDPFLGSGTTLVTAEQLGRKCYGLELSPSYTDVIVHRWEALTGRKAERQKA